MDVIKAIESRRSVRKFQDKEVPKSLLSGLIEAARLAPSAYNAQPTKFLIIKNKKIKEKLKENNVFKQEFVYAAPVIIICCGNPDVYPKERLEAVYSNPSEIAGEVGTVRDIAIATQNLVLRATELGLGTCYIGLVAREKAKEILNIPIHYVLPFVIIAGYPAENPKAMPRKSQADLILWK